MFRTIAAAVTAALLLLAAPARGAEKIIIDTDIGDDIDDAFALALALKSPELEILGVTTDFGDTEARARMTDRMLAVAGRSDIPVAMGTPSTANLAAFTQRAYADGAPRRSHAAAVDFILEQIRKYPGQITLVAVAPSPNIGELIARDPATFRKLKRVVTMGGSITPLSDGFGAVIAPHPEWNVKNDIVAQQKLYASGVPVVMMPLDSTANLKLQEIARNQLFSRGTPLTDALTVLYHQWVYGTHGQVTPTLYDPMTLAWLLKPSLCPTTPMHITVTDDGMTTAGPGAPNAQVCLHSDSAAFTDFYLSRVAH